MIAHGLAILLSLGLPGDTLRLEVGSPAVDGRIYPEHRARNRVYRGAGPIGEWNNELTLGDSAGRPVMRWVSRGGPVGGPVSWELLQTYDAITLAPYTYTRNATSGAYLHLRFDGPRVTGMRRTSATAEPEPFERTLKWAAFPGHASDLVPLAVGLRAGAVMTLPVWSPDMPDAVMHVFTVLPQEERLVEGERVQAWRVEERREADGQLVATWFLTDRTPYMVDAEIPLPNGGVQRITGVDLGGR